ncbi:hypothetical protein [Nocardiopsis sp. FR26]|uniref:hypothetical protein n=1 Tax=Nocardiopsis sp. FR26 TaxID=2605987 RepID=UPI0013586FF6|nr:hypothetical protein [Nocardiopsis sp. FR26]
MTTPTPPPQYAHLGELLTLMREEMRRGFDEIKQELADRVSADVYAADKRLQEDRIARLGAEVAELRADLKREEEAQKAERIRAVDRRAADRRMVWGAVIAGVLSLVVGAVLLALQFLTA